MQACGVNASTDALVPPTCFSPLFRKPNSTTVELYDTDGAAGAASRVRDISTSAEAFSGLTRQAVIEEVAAHRS